MSDSDVSEVPSAMREMVNADFTEAAQEGKLHLVTMLWETGYVEDVDCRNAEGWTALLFASAHGDTAMAQFLLEQGASTMSRSYQSLTPLHFAALRGDIEMLDLLCRFGADVNAHGLQGRTPLELAIERGISAASSFLIKHGASTEFIDKDKTMAVDIAIAKDDIEELRVLVQDEEAMLRQNENADTVLMRACLAGDKHAVTCILEALDEVGATETKRALVNMPRLSKWTPLTVAADCGDLELVVLLVTHGANVATENDGGFTPLHSATQKGHDNVVEYLLAQGVDTETANVGECTPLVTAAKEGFGRIVDMLLERGAKVNHQNINGFSALLDAALDGHTDIVKALLRHGADVELRHTEGWTSLLFATERGHVDIVRCLLDHGANVDCQGNDHWTPLTRAAYFGFTDICALLLKRGASTSLQATDGKTALHLAASGDHQQIIRMLLDAGANPHARDFHGHTATYCAMLEGYFTPLSSATRHTSRVFISAERAWRQVRQWWQSVRPCSSRQHLATDQLSDSPEVGEPWYEGEIWPRVALYKLYGVTNVQEPSMKRQNPPWWIARSSIVSIEPYFATSLAQVSVGTWMSSRVVIVEPMIALFRFVSGGKDPIRLRQQFRKEVSQLYPLRHPHVIRLYGANHNGESPFLVMEHSQNGTLRSFVAEQKHRTWAILHEVALGLQYLHERGIVHRELMGDNIYMGDDGLAKILPHGLFSKSLNAESTLVWDAPEVLLGKARTFESDVYSLGMCIVEAASGELPYANEAKEQTDLEELITGGTTPTKPHDFSTRGWALVMQMICFHHRKRLKISDVVRELAALAQEETLEARNLASDSGDHIHVGAVDNTEMEGLFTLANSLLSAKRDDSDHTSLDIETPQIQVVQRLHMAWLASERVDPFYVQTVLSQLKDILSRVTNHLQANTTRAAMFTAQRQNADRVFSFHNEIDHLVSERRELLATTDTLLSVHTWRNRWYEHRRAELQAFGESLAHVDELDVESCTCLLFELTKHRDEYSSIPPLVIHDACIKMRSMTDVHVPDWFIPHYEVVFDEFQSFSRGAFGSVHHGVWMGSRAVIKKVFADKDGHSTEFEQEVELWSQLYHPHVLQLFGACHVGQRFLVSEFAAHGQLDHYLRRLEQDPKRRQREVWRTLHDAALGLQYLHSRHVVHCDLKCNNILVGRDGKAKVSDYGLSRVQLQTERVPAPEETSSPDTFRHSPEHEATGVGAPRWKAPEVLNGAEPTVEADVYAFGMCVVEAVTGEYPWGPHDRDELVSDHVRRGGKLFAKPHGFSDAQWDLVVGMCRFDPTKRLQLPEIIHQLHVFVNEATDSESESDDDVTGTDPTKHHGLTEPEPEKYETSASDSTAFSATAPPVPGTTKQTIGLCDSEPGTTNTSYSESW